MEASVEGLGCHVLELKLDWPLAVICWSYNLGLTGTLEQNLTLITVAFAHSSHSKPSGIFSERGIRRNT